MYLTAGSIYRFLLAQDDKLDTLILCSSGQIDLLTTDQSLYEALGSFEDRSSIDMNRLVKLLEVTDILSYRRSMAMERPILTENRVDDIRRDLGKDTKEMPEKSNQESKSLKDDDIEIARSIIKSIAKEEKKEQKEHAGKEKATDGSNI